MCLFKSKGKVSYSNTDIKSRNLAIFHHTNDTIALFVSCTVKKHTGIPFVVKIRDSLNDLLCYTFFYK